MSEQNNRVTEKKPGHDKHFWPLLKQIDQAGPQRPVSTKNTVHNLVSNPAALHNK